MKNIDLKTLLVGALIAIGVYAVIHFAKQNINAMNHQGELPPAIGTKQN
jgi:hypothetical protein